jgi:hypothetical protein
MMKRIFMGFEGSFAAGRCALSAQPVRAERAARAVRGRFSLIPLMGEGEEFLGQDGLDFIEGCFVSDNTICLPHF